MPKAPTKPKPDPLAEVRVRESAAGPMAGRIDPDRPIIRDVKILGLKSVNGKEYLPSCLESGRRLIEGRIVNIDHVLMMGDSRPFLNRFGRLRDVRVVEGDGLRGDLHYNPEHPIAPAFLGWVKNDPSAVGLSIDALCRCTESVSGVKQVHEFRHVDSVDLVADPATTMGLFESVKLTRAKESAVDETAVIDTPAPVADGGTDEHIGNAIKSLVMDTAMDGKAKLKKIKSLMKALSDAEEEIEAETETETVTESEDERAEESVRQTPAGKRVLAQLEAFRLKEAAALARGHAERMCEAAKLPKKIGGKDVVTDLFLEQLTEAVDDAARSRLIADRKGLIGVSTRPISQGPTPPPPAPEVKPLTADDIVLGARS